VNNETPVYAEGLVATVYLDTTGFGLGSPGDPWDLRLGNILDGIVGDIGTGFAHQSVGNILPEITNGTITIIPEPSTCVMLVLCGLCLLGWRLRRGKDS
jgi:hypothetical protein